METKLLLFVFFIFVSLNNIYAQAPFIQWQKCLGGIFDDGAFSVCQTADGGYIVAGVAYSNDGDVTGNHNTTGTYPDYWVVKLDNIGNIQWQKCLGGTSGEFANSVEQTIDGGYIVAGYATSIDGDVTGNHGNIDYWIVKLDSIGNIEWQKCLGGTNADMAYTVQQTTDGGYFVAGKTVSNDGDVTGNHGNYDEWVVKLDGSGNIQWQKCLGGTSAEYANCVEQTNDGGYIVVGETWSNDGDVTGNHGGQDYWIVKLDSSGNIQWQKCLGGTSDEWAQSVRQTNDGGYIAAGFTLSNDGDVTGNHGNWDEWIVKLDGSGSIQWQKCLGGTNTDKAQSIEQTNNGGYIVAGYTQSNDGDVTGLHGSQSDYWVVTLDSSGNIQWQKCLGGTTSDYALSVQQTADGGYIIAGETNSNDGDVTGLHGSQSDYWVVKLSPLTAIEEESNKGAFNIYPNPATNEILISNSGFLIFTVEIIDVLGQLQIPNFKPQTNSVDISSLRSGIYFVKVFIGENLYCKKLIVE